MTAHDDDNSDDAVGYRLPPKAHRFKKGQSGNAKGRPKGATSVGTVLQKRLFALVTIVENGRRRKVTVLEAFFAKIIKDSFAGESRAADKLMKLLPLLDATFADTASLKLAQMQADADDGSSCENDRRVLEAMARMLGASADAFFTSEKSDA